MRAGSFLILLAVAGSLRAETPVIRLTAPAAAAPVPALKYQLLPELRDLHAGNAALLYQRAHAAEWFGSFRRDPDYPQMSDWLQLADDKMPWQKVKALLPVNALKEVDLAARREQCDWELAERVRQDGFSLLLPDVQGFREYALFLALRARVEMHDGNIDKAIRTLQTTLALSRHVGESPTLISNLVGLAVAHIALDQVQHFIQVPGAPNLYWALTNLPRPFLDLQKAFQGERLTLDGMFPEVRAHMWKPALGPVPVQRLQESLIQFERLAEGTRENFGTTVALAVAAAKVYPAARKYLSAHGFDEAQLEAVPVMEAALIYALAEYDRHFDDMAKWLNVPYWEAQAGLKNAERELKLSKAHFFETGGIPLAHLLLPATQKVLASRVRLDRRIAALRCLEAVRLHAAKHGALPAALGDIKDVPVPIDPVTGRSFDYQVEGEKVILVGPPPRGEPPLEQNSLRYELTLRK